MITYRKTGLALLTASALGLAGCGSDGDDGTDGSASASSAAGASATSDANGDDPVAASADGGVAGTSGSAADDDVAPGGGTGVPTTSDDPSADPDDGPDDGESEDALGEVPDTAVAPAADDIDLGDENSRVVTADCGALPVLDTAPGTSFDAPGTLVEGQPARAGIDPDLPNDGTHYWQVDLEPGFHHLFVESRRLDAQSSNLGLEIRDVGAEDDDGTRLIGFDRVGYRTREHAFFENPAARTVILAVTPSYAAEDYVIGVFANGRAIPSPYFEDCPQVSTLAVGTTEALELPELESADDYVWYEIDLARDRYAIEGTVSRPDGRDSNLIYEIDAFDAFGDRGTQTRLLGINQVGVTSTDRDTFAQSPAGTRLLRLYGQATPLNLQFTIAPDED